MVSRGVGEVGVVSFRPDQCSIPPLVYARAPKNISKQAVLDFAAKFGVVHSMHEAPSAGMFTNRVISYANKKSALLCCGDSPQNWQWRIELHLRLPSNRHHFIFILFLFFGPLGHKLKQTCSKTKHKCQLCCQDNFGLRNW